MPWIELIGHHRRIPLTDKDMTQLACGRTVQFMSAEIRAVFKRGKIESVEVVSGNPTKWTPQDAERRMLTDG